MSVAPYPPRSAHLSSLLFLCIARYRSSVAIIVLVYGATIYTSNKNCSLSRSLGTTCKDVCAERGTTAWKWIDAQRDNNKREGAIIWTLEIPEYLNLAINVKFISPMLVFGRQDDGSFCVSRCDFKATTLTFSKNATDSISNLFSQLRLKSLCQNRQQKDEKCGN